MFELVKLERIKFRGYTDTGKFLLKGVLFVVAIVILEFYVVPSNDINLFWHAFLGMGVSQVIYGSYIKRIKDKAVELDYLAPVSKLKDLVAKMAYSYSINLLYFFLGALSYLNMDSYGYNGVEFIMNGVFMFLVLWILALTFKREFLLYIASILVPYLMIIVLKVSIEVIICMSIVGVLILIIQVYYELNKIS